MFLSAAQFSAIYISVFLTPIPESSIYRLPTQLLFISHLTANMQLQVSTFPIAKQVSINKGNNLTFISVPQAILSTKRKRKPLQTETT